MIILTLKIMMYDCTIENFTVHNEAGRVGDDKKVLVNDRTLSRRIDKRDLSGRLEILLVKLDGFSRVDD